MSDNVNPLKGGHIRDHTGDKYGVYQGSLVLTMAHVVPETAFHPQMGCSHGLPVGERLYCGTYYLGVPKWDPNFDYLIPK